MPDMSSEALVASFVVLGVVGLLAGALNSVVGSGSLVTFPVLVAIGVSPLPATLTSSVGLTASNFSGPWGYRALLREQSDRLRLLAPVAAAGGLTGSLLLTRLPAAAFATVAPVLILLAVVLVLVQPVLQRRLAAFQSPTVAVPPLPERRRLAAVIVLMFIAAVYGGYFVAAQGVFMFGILGVLLGGDLRYVNALKNALASMVNVLAAAVYVVTAFDRILWAFVAPIALGSAIGGLVGATVARRVPGPALRWLIAAVGTVGLGALLLRQG